MRICSEALPFVLPTALAATVAVALSAHIAAIGLVLITVAVAAFFRNPPRTSTAPEDSVLAPADGVVVNVRVDTNGVIRIAIFLSVLNVHVVRAPVAGRVASSRHLRGSFRMAFRRSASSNARTVLELTTPYGQFQLSLIAGAIARRVVPWYRINQCLHRGDRIAIIRFGSRAELQTPAGYLASVSKGDRVRAGHTEVARPR